MTPSRKKCKMAAISIFVAACLVIPKSDAVFAAEEDFSWHLEQIDAPSETAFDPGNPAVVAVIDTGVRTDHPALADSLWVNEAEKAGKEGEDDDGNGYIDDVYGYNVRSDSGDVEDTDGHGTHVAGLIAMKQTGKSGVRGVDPNARLMVIKAGNSTNGFSSKNVVEGIQYAVKNGADVINLSLGTGFCTDELREAISEASKQAVVVAAAGNDHSPTSESPGDGGENMFPAGLPDVIGVMSSDRDNQLAWFSNWDSQPGTEVDYEIAAPGEDIYSAALNGQYRTESGTSMSTAIVSGACCLLIDEWRSIQKGSDGSLPGPAIIRECVLSGTGEPVVHTGESGGGQEFPSLNVSSALSYLHSHYESLPSATPTASPTPTVSPGTSAGTPGTSTGTPDTSTETPGTSTENPITPTTSPVTPTNSPTTPTASPVTPTDSPTTPTAAPVTPTDNPDAAGDEDGSTYREPSSSETTDGSDSSGSKKKKIQKKKASVRKVSLSKKKTKLLFSIGGVSPNGWYLYRSAKKKGTYKCVKKLKKNSAVIKKGKKYYYVRAYKKIQGKKYFSKKSKIIRG